MTLSSFLAGALTASIVLLGCGAFNAAAIGFGITLVGIVLYKWRL